MLVGFGRTNVNELGFIGCAEVHVAGWVWFAFGFYFFGGLVFGFNDLGLFFKSSFILAILLSLSSVVWLFVFVRFYLSYAYLMPNYSI